VSAEFPASAAGATTPVTPDYGTEDGHVEHAHAHNPLVAHQFDDLAQQKEAGILGMWSFLATEIMFFGGALLAYAIYRSHYHYAFAAASNLELWKVGLFNTFVLLASSYTVVRAVHHAQNGRNDKVFKWIIYTILFGLAFIAIKGYEYHHVYAEHLIPGPNFDRQVLEEPGVHSEREFNGHWFPEYLRRPAQIFFSFYFALTGIHALHMVVGVGIMSWVAWLAKKKEFSTDYYNPVEIAGLYWHFVDIVWIFLYPLLYLIDRTYHP
jgi:cytochrome c oxidase subunit 3